MDSVPRPAVLVFARWWAEGPVKTRLAATVGAEEARHIYRDLAAAVWAGLAADDLQRRLWVAPAEASDAVAGWLQEADAVRAQPPGELGERLHAAFAEAFAAGAPWAAAVGTDAPAVDSTRVLAAGDALRKADVALIPAEDGGYALLALKAPQPALFRDIPWGGPEVLQTTLERAQDGGLRTALLEPVRDLDTAEDLEALRAAGLLPG